jgi:DNA-binding beta-propeller fold protein YncE
MKTLKHMTKRLISRGACLVLTLMMSFGVWNSATAESFPETIPLPTGFQPEGITLGNGPTAYVGSLADGSIYKVDLRTGAGNVLVEGSPGSMLAVVGLDFDARSGYLFVAGGFSGDGFVYDTETGELIHPLFFGGWWINDVVVTQDAAYFTESLLPRIYKVPLDSQGAQSGAAEFLPLSGDWIHIPTTNPSMPMINANGIVATPDNGTLIVVNWVTGLLYTVDPDTGFATKIDLGGITVPAGDGLVLRGKTLYVVQNFIPTATLFNQISVFTLSPDYTSAKLTRVLTKDDPFVPSTADLFGPWLYAVNARFDVCFPLTCDPTPFEFDIVRVDQ